MNRLVVILLCIAGVIHLLPLPGVLGGAALQRLYGLTLEDPATLLLLRHRAVMFGLLGAALIAAAFRPEWRVPAIAAGLVSSTAFLLLAGNPVLLDAALRRVWVADVVAVLALALAAACRYRPA